MQLSTTNLVTSFILGLSVVRKVLGLSPSLHCDYDTFDTTDVVILGGGAAGTYAAVQLHRQNRTVALIEKQGRLGGQVNTFLEQERGISVEYGVSHYMNEDVTTELFDYLGIPYYHGTVPKETVTHFDFETGRLLEEQHQNDTAQAIQVYKQHLAQYPYLEDGFSLPDPVPEDLVLPFGSFATKYGIEKAVASLSVGMGSVLDIPTIYVMKHYGLGVFKNDFLFTSHKNNQEIYDTAEAVLGSSVLLSSRALAIQRTRENNVEICVKTPTGTRLLHAKYLMITLPPTLDNLRSTGLDLTREETALFSELAPIGFYVALVRIAGLQRDILPLQNAAANDTTYRVAQLPGIWDINPTAIHDLFIVEYGSDIVLPDDLVYDQLLKALDRLRDAGFITGEGRPELIRFANHSPFYPHVQGKAIHEGFYGRLNGLQGKTNTFWAGSTFHVPDSTSIWRSTRKILADLTANLST
ncbi:FAD/NAD(P)-binding domain-containing protein [Aspergillus campestris IBT 28561]|uniref:FAD/NAD(P)-binding domain-containing protein n=1 Tax=Aspergillus campestris (strain IBT 28561) TaxID=1392248 RepID=A0A2I1CRF3_ASPC2|nr:FAD/NAD(P)-binding domain-containing protein [Aspergillus campestris IBT 28561]PKY00204.1 FAD/NAD(P)-binding domain-containing protein [Aspergillus campestris IBT 28561]